MRLAVEGQKTRIGQVCDRLHREYGTLEMDLSRDIPAEMNMLGPDSGRRNIAVENIVASRSVSAQIRLVQHMYRLICPLRNARKDFRVDYQWLCTGFQTFISIVDYQN